MTAAPPRVSILVPAYNSQATLERCLLSACSQTMQDIEILVMDDASTDGTAACAKRLAMTDPRIIVFTSEANKGKPSAMNAMMAEARGKWVAVLDADDAMDARRLDHLISRAEQRGVAMVADNLHYVDSGVPGGEAGFGTILRTAFSQTAPDRVLTLESLLSDSSNHGEFDYGLLKPIILRSFVSMASLTYYEASRLAEDFTYLLDYMVAGGTTLLCSTPLYFWTLPFGTVSRKWTSTGAGAWRYDYRGAITANAHHMLRMEAKGKREVAEMLKRRGKQYIAMMHYIDAQRTAAEGSKMRAAAHLVRNPSTWSLLLRRIYGRLARALNVTATKRRSAGASAH